MRLEKKGFRAKMFIPVTPVKLRFKILPKNEIWFGESGKNLIKLNVLNDTSFIYNDFLNIRKFLMLCFEFCICQNKSIKERKHRNNFAFESRNLSWLYIRHSMPWCENMDIWVEKISWQIFLWCIFAKTQLFVHLELEIWLYNFP